VPPPTLWSGGYRAHSLAGEGLGESQFRRGDIHCGALSSTLWLKPSGSFSNKIEIFLEADVILVILSLSACILHFFYSKFWTLGHFSSFNASEKWPERHPRSRSADCLFTHAHCTGSEGRACPQRLAIPPGLHQGGHSGM
jgi:hypothetical protein